MKCTIKIIEITSREYTTDIDSPPTFLDDVRKELTLLASLHGWGEPKKTKTILVTKELDGDIMPITKRWDE